MGELKKLSEIKNPTVTGKTVGENLSGVKTLDKEVIARSRPPTRPPEAWRCSSATGAGRRGGQEGRRRPGDAGAPGRARVFNSEEAATRAI
jgi:hypothetical protein